MVTHRLQDSNHWYLTVSTCWCRLVHWHPSQSHQGIAQIRCSPKDGYPVWGGEREFTLRNTSQAVPWGFQPSQ